MGGDMGIRKLGAVVAVLALAGCATALTEAGGSVTLLTAAPSPSDAGGLAEVGVVTCERGGALEIGSLEKNIKACRNELRNKAAKLGAHVIVIDRQDVRVSGLCENCVTLTGVAYRRKG